MIAMIDFVVWVPHVLQSHYFACAKDIVLYDVWLLQLKSTEVLHSLGIWNTPSQNLMNTAGRYDFSTSKR